MAESSELIDQLLKSVKNENFSHNEAVLLKLFQILQRDIDENRKELELIFGTKIMDLPQDKEAQMSYILKEMKRLNINTLDEVKRRRIRGINKIIKDDDPVFLEFQAMVTYDLGKREHDPEEVDKTEGMDRAALKKVWENIETQQNFFQAITGTDPKEMPRFETEKPNYIKSVMYDKGFTTMDKINNFVAPEGVRFNPILFNIWRTELHSDDKDEFKDADKDKVDDVEIKAHSTDPITVIQTVVEYIANELEKYHEKSTTSEPEDAEEKLLWREKQIGRDMYSVVEDLLYQDISTANSDEEDPTNFFMNIVGYWEWIWPEFGDGYEALVTDLRAELVGTDKMKEVLQKFQNSNLEDPEVQTQISIETNQRLDPRNVNKLAHWFLMRWVINRPEDGYTIENLDLTESSLKKLSEDELERDRVSLEDLYVFYTSNAMNYGKTREELNADELVATLTAALALSGKPELILKTFEKEQIPTTLNQRKTMARKIYREHGHVKIMAYLNFLAANNKEFAEWWEAYNNPPEDDDEKNKDLISKIMDALEDKRNDTLLLFNMALEQQLETSKERYAVAKKIFNDYGYANILLRFNELASKNKEFAVWWKKKEKPKVKKKRKVNVDSDGEEIESDFEEDESDEEEEFIDQEYVKKLRKENAKLKKQVETLQQQLKAYRQKKGKLPIVRDDETIVDSDSESSSDDSSSDEEEWDEDKFREQNKRLPSKTLKKRFRNQRSRREKNERRALNAINKSVDWFEKNVINKKRPPSPSTDPRKLKVLRPDNYEGVSRVESSNCYVPSEYLLNPNVPMYHKYYALLEHSPKHAQVVLKKYRAVLKPQIRKKVIIALKI